MNTKKIFLLTLMSCLLLLTKAQDNDLKSMISKGLERAEAQYMHMAAAMTDSGRLPRSIDKNGSLVFSGSEWWCSGFVPGTFWYLAEAFDNSNFSNLARKYTAWLEKEKFNTHTHDLGFMLNCSYGNGYRLRHDNAYKNVLLTGAQSLKQRFHANIGCIQSWEKNDKWQYPVIIDNMMNLEFLMWAFHETGDSSFYNVCVKHADTTMKNHFRPDYSCYHMVSYDTITGKPHFRGTVQGAADASAWARGQSWALYGYTVMYRETRLQRYLDQANHIAGFLLSHPNLPKDKIPYWDYNAPGIPDAKRDASAAAVMASALIELSGFVEAKTSKTYMDVAETQLRVLSSPEYTASVGSNGNFLLKHSVGHLPANSEVDVPLTYADYYYVEALLRLKSKL